MSELVKKITKEDLEMLKQMKKNSTEVVGWYHHPGGQIRGPFGRWIVVSEIPLEYRKHVAHVDDDAKYAAAAMNYLPKLIERIEELENMLALEDMFRE